MRRGIWMAFGIAEAALGLVGLAGWFVLTEERSTAGVAWQPWQPAGAGLLVVAYLVLIVIVGLLTAAGATARWTGWVHASLAVALIVPLYLAVTGPAGSGDPTFVGGVAAICAAAISAALRAAVVVIRRGEHRV